MSFTKAEKRELKVFVINRIKRMEKRQKEFFQRIESKKGMDDFLSVEEIEREFGISRSTFNRYRAQGLKVFQNGYKGRISVKKADYIEFLKDRKLW